MRYKTRGPRLLGLTFLMLIAGQLVARGIVPPPEPIPPPQPGFFQVVTPAMIVETDVSKDYTDKVAKMVQTAEIKFYNLFKLTPELMRGVSREYFDGHNNIPGTIMWDVGLHQYIDVRVYKDMEKFADEWFEGRGVKDKQARLHQGIPGAYFSVASDYEKKRMQRSIRTFVANRDDNELERTLLHEMGHLFMMSYLLDFAGDPPAGQESQKRGTPSWLQEGLAQLFENLWSNGAASQKARLRQQAMIYEAMQIGDSYPFAEFTNITNAHNLAAVANDPLRSTLNYAQSMSVMDYMVNVDGARFFNFLQNLRADNFEKNLRSRDRNHIPELYSYQNDAFKKAFNADLKEVEGYWKKNIKKTMEAQLTKQPELYYWIGEYYLLRRKDKENDLAKAEENFNLAMTQAPTKGEGYLGVGRLALAKGNNERALTTLAKAAEYMPKDDEAWYFYGAAQVQAKMYKEACESFNQAVKIYPRNANALDGLGNAAFACAQYDKAAEAYGQAYEADVNRNPVYLFQKGQADFFAKKYRDAQSGFARFCDVFPKDPQGQFWYGMAAQRLGDKDFAIKKLEEACALNSNPNDTRMKEALAMAKRGEILHFGLETNAETANKKAAEAPASKNPFDDKKAAEPPASKNPFDDKKTPTSKNPVDE